MPTENAGLIDELQRRLADATDAQMRLNGARKFALRSGDEEWLADVNAAYPATRDAQVAASDALAAAIEDAIETSGRPLPDALVRRRALIAELRAPESEA